MIVINGQATVDPARRADYVAAVIALQQASRQEPGCLHYVWTVDVEDENLFHVAEKWTGEDALKEHFTMPHIAAYRDATKGAVTGGTFVKYQVSSEGPVF